MINVAVVGAGSISGFHIEGCLPYPDRCRIVAVADIDKARAEERIARYGLDAVAASDVGEILAGPGIDLASVWPPPGTHGEIPRNLLSAGVPPLCEKPMAPSLVECDSMIAAAERSGAI